MGAFHFLNDHFLEYDSDGGGRDEKVWRRTPCDENHPPDPDKRGKIMIFVEMRIVIIYILFIVGVRGVSVTYLNDANFDRTKS